MPLQKLKLKPGVNRENTRYTSEGGWYEGNYIRFRQGTPEKIGGWQQISSQYFLGMCRSLWAWTTLSGRKYVGIGTHTAFYVEFSGTYSDITPIVSQETRTNPLTTDSGSPYITVTVASTAGLSRFQRLIISGASTVGGIDPNGMWEITNIVNSTTFQMWGYPDLVIPSSTATGGGTLTLKYLLTEGLPYTLPQFGFGSGTWGQNGWGEGSNADADLRIWSQSNFGEDLVMNVRGGGIYYWDSSLGIGEHAVNIRDVPVTHILDNPFTTTNASTSVAVTDAYHNVQVGDRVTFSGATAVGGLTINGTYTVTTVVDVTQYTITAGSAASSSATGGGNVTAVYAYNRTAPSVANWVLVSDVYRFVLAFGTNELGGSVQDEMLIRWPDQESLTEWEPKATNQAGSLRLSRGSKIVTAIQMKQEVLVFTDTAMYSLQYLGAPGVWGATLVADNISIAGPNAVTVASGVAYWMGVDKFYVYNGSVSTLNCDLRQYVFSDFNQLQTEQTYAGTNERFNEIWWFYCGAESRFNSLYVTYNYVENVWAYGTMHRDAWLDSGILDYPIAAYTPGDDPGTYTSYAFGRLVNHEYGLDDALGGIDGTANPSPINAYISSAEFDIEDGDKFGFIWRMLPDITFRGSTAENPSVTMTLYPMKNSGSGFGTSVGGSDNAAVTRSVAVPVEQFTGQVYIRVRGRQMVIKVESNALGVAWQLGSPRIDIRMDGRR